MSSRTKILFALLVIVLLCYSGVIAPEKVLIPFYFIGVLYIIFSILFFVLSFF